MARALWKFAVILGSAEGFHVVPITAKTLSTLRTPAPAMDGQGSVWDVEKNVPRRWSSVHDCERPVKWREALESMTQQATPGFPKIAPITKHNLF